MEKRRCLCRQCSHSKSLRTRGSTTSGLFSDSQSLAGSDSDSALREHRDSSTHTSRQLAEAPRRNAEPWKSVGACAGSVRAAGLSRTHGSTVSGLFSDVQPLAGSESAALMAAKLQNSSRLRRSRSRRLSRSTSQPSLLSSCSSSSNPSPKELAVFEPETQAEEFLTNVRSEPSDTEKVERS